MGTAQCTVSGISAGNLARLAALTLQRISQSCPEFSTASKIPNETSLTYADVHGMECVSAVGSFVSSLTGVLASSTAMGAQCRHKPILATLCTSQISRLVGTLGGITSASANAALACPNATAQSTGQDSMRKIISEHAGGPAEEQARATADPQDAQSEQLAKIGECVLMGIGPADLMAQWGLILKYSTMNCPLVSKLSLKRRFCSINVLGLISIFESVVSLTTQTFMSCSGHTNPTVSCTTSVADMANELVSITEDGLFMGPLCGDDIRKLRRQKAAAAAAAKQVQQVV